MSGEGGAKGGKAGAEPTLADVLAAVNKNSAEFSAKLDNLKDTVTAQADLLDDLGTRMATVEAAPAAAPFPAEPGDGDAGLLERVTGMAEELASLKERPAGQETAEQAKARYDRELKRESDRLKKAGHRQFVHFDPAWCLKQEPPVPLVKNVMGADAARDAAAEGYYPSLRDAAQAAALAESVRAAQDAAVARFLKVKPEAREEEVTVARQEAAQSVKPASPAAVQRHMLAIHKAVGKVGHEGWQVLPKDGRAA